MARQKTQGYKERLSLALERGPRPMSVRQFAAELEGQHPDLRGTSYGGVRLYAEPGDGPRNPRVELLRAMADVLGVRPEWLSFGEGAMTERAEEERLVAEGMAGGPLAADYRKAQGRRDAFEREVNDALRAAFRVPVSAVAQAVFLRSLSLVNAAPAISFRTTERLTAAQFAAALGAGLVQLAEVVGKPNSETVESYIIEVAPALARAGLDTWTQSLNRPVRHEEDKPAKPRPTRGKGQRTTKKRQTKRED